MAGRNVEPNSDLIRYIAALEKRVQALERSRQLGNSTVDVGTFKVLSDGVVLMTVGDLGGTSAQGFAFWYPSGGAALALSGADPVIQIWDQSGQEVISTDVASNKGLARPYIPYTVMNTADIYTPPLSTTDSDPVALATLLGLKQHPRIRFFILIQNPAGTTSESRIYDAQRSMTLSTLSHADGFYGYVTHTVTVDPDASYTSLLQLDVQFLRTSGSGTPRMAIAHAYGVQS